MMRLIYFIGGFLTGGVIGVVGVLLTTPESGENLRAQLNDWVQGKLSIWQQAASGKKTELQARVATLRGQ